MKIETQYSMGDTVWLLYSDRAGNAYVQEANVGRINIRVGPARLTQFDQTEEYECIFKSNQGSPWVDKSKLFPTKDKLLASL